MNDLSHSSSCIFILETSSQQLVTNRQRALTIFDSDARLMREVIERLSDEEEDDQFILSNSTSVSDEQTYRRT